VTASSPQAQFQHAAQLYETRQYEAAMQLLVNLSRVAPGQAGVWQLLGLAHSQLENAEQAEASFLRALELSPRDPQTLNNLGILYRKTERFEEARAAYCKAVAIQPGFAQAWYNLGLLCNHLEEWADAEAAFGKVLARVPNHAGALVGLGVALGNQRRYAEAIEAYQAALAQDGQRLEALHNLGVALKIEGRWPEAVECLQKAAQIAPDNPRVMHNLGAALRLAGRTDEALAALSRAVELDPDDLDNHHWLSELLWAQGREDFVRSFESARNRRPQNADLRLQLGLHLMYAGRHEEAERELRDALGFAPERFDIRQALGSVMHEMERYDESLAEFETALAQSPGNLTILDGMGHVLLGMGEPDRGLKVFQDLLRHQPHSVAWWAMKATALRMLGAEEYNWLYDFDQLVLMTDIEVPAGYRNITEFNEALLAELDQYHYDLRHPLRQSVKGGTQTTDHLFHIQEPHIQMLKRAMEEQINAFVAGLKPDPAHPTLCNISKKTEFIGAWSIKNPRGGFHLNHHHDEGWFSGPYYVQLPAVIRADDATHQGWVTFGQPGFKMVDLLEPDLKVTPRPGMMVLFPSYMWHGTIPFDSDEYRVTVAQDTVQAA
jgi:tetratricopeptide (TPR) repeat protein